jgi:hypothetical protein
MPSEALGIHRCWCIHVRSMLEEPVSHLHFAVVHADAQERSSVQRSSAEGLSLIRAAAQFRGKDLFMDRTGMGRTGFLGTAGRGTAVLDT